MTKIPYRNLIIENSISAKKTPLALAPVSAETLTLFGRAWLVLTRFTSDQMVREYLRVLGKFQDDKV